MNDKTFSARLKLIENYLFEIDFGEAGSIMSDEPAPLGGAEGPSPSQMLAAAVSNCLAASLMFAIRKYKGDPGEVTAEVTGTMEREEGRLRIKQIDVTLKIDNEVSNLPKIDRVLEQFENFCIVTQSVEVGIPVNLEVVDQSNTVLKKHRT